MKSGQKSGRSASPSAASKAPRTQNNRRRGLGGAPVGNGNAKKSLEWLDSYNLSSPEGVDQFLQQVIRATWTGELGTRAAGALNGSLRILLEHLTLPALEKRIEALEDHKAVSRN